MDYGVLYNQVSTLTAFLTSSPSVPRLQTHHAWFCLKSRTSNLRCWFPQLLQQVRPGSFHEVFRELPDHPTCSSNPQRPVHPVLSHRSLLPLAHSTYYLKFSHLLLCARVDFLSLHTRTQAPWTAPRSDMLTVVTSAPTLNGLEWCRTENIQEQANH